MSCSLQTPGLKKSRKGQRKKSELNVINHQQAKRNVHLPSIFIAAEPNEILPFTAWLFRASSSVQELESKRPTQLSLRKHFSARHHEPSDRSLSQFFPRSHLCVFILRQGMSKVGAEGAFPNTAFSRQHQDFVFHGLHFLFDFLYSCKESSSGDDTPD